MWCGTFGRTQRTPLAIHKFRILALTAQDVKSRDTTNSDGTREIMDGEAKRERGKCGRKLERERWVGLDVVNENVNFLQTEVLG